MLGLALGRRCFHIIRQISTHATISIKHSAFVLGMVAFRPKGGLMVNEDYGLFLIDWQARLFPAMPEPIAEKNLANAIRLKWISESLKLPIWVSEQYPKGLGSTLDVLQPVIAHEKTTFSALGNDALLQSILSAKPKHMIISGMETHICVYQTAMALIDHGIEPIIAIDACLSRRKLDWRVAIDTLSVTGAKIMTTEMILFHLIQDASHPLFKEVSRRIK